MSYLYLHILGHILCHIHIIDHIWYNNDSHIIDSIFGRSILCPKSEYTIYNYVINRNYISANPNVYTYIHGYVYIYIFYLFIYYIVK